MGKLSRFIGGIIFWLIAVGMIAWACCAINYSNLSPQALRTALATGFGVLALGWLVLAKRPLLRVGVFLAAFTAVAAWWTTIPASNDRDWMLDVAVLSSATVEGDLVTIRNVRDFKYRTETDYTVHYYDRTYDLKLLQSVDLISVYWMGDAIAHTMLSFGFSNGDRVVFSIEIRKEENEEYSTIKGLFKQYELIYVVADERDVLWLRTSVRDPNEDVYVYRTRMPRRNIGKLFLEYIKRVRSLEHHPEFYNTLTTNCTTDIIGNIRAFGGRAKYSWKIILSGYTPLYAYENGALDMSLPFPELHDRSLINHIANKVGNVPDFSSRIREGLPGMGE